MTNDNDNDKIKYTKPPKSTPKPTPSAADMQKDALAALDTVFNSIGEFFSEVGDAFVDAANTDTSKSTPKPASATSSTPKDKMTKPKPPMSPRPPRPVPPMPPMPPMPSMFTHPAATEMPKTPTAPKAAPSAAPKPPNLGDSIKLIGNAFRSGVEKKRAEMKAAKENVDAVAEASKARAKAERHKAAYSGSDTSGGGIRTGRITTSDGVDNGEINIGEGYSVTAQTVINDRTFTVSSERPATAHTIAFRGDRVLIDGADVTDLLDARRDEMRERLHDAERYRDQEGR